MAIFVAIVKRLRQPQEARLTEELSWVNDLELPFGVLLLPDVLFRYYMVKRLLICYLDCQAILPSTFRGAK